MSKKKYPDNIVYNDKLQKFDANVKPYPTSVGSQAFEPIKVDKSTSVVANHYFNSRLEELREEYKKLIQEYRPWGKYEILHEEKNYKVKKITVKPGGRLSYQYHHKRSEVWTIVSGEAYMLLNDELSLHTYGETILIPQGTKHRVENKGQDDLVFIEVQHGSYFGEDDIVRIEDDYNRK